MVRHGAVDPRRTLRDAMGHGGEIVAFSRRSTKPKPRPLLLLADISGSMADYTEPLLYLLHALAQWPGRRVEVFLFGTQLTRVTPLLHAPCIEEALHRVAMQASDWSGGTRTGEALRTLRRRYGGQALRGRPESVVISDGWDRGDPRLLRDEIAHLHRTSRRLIWLTPLLRDPAYEPLTQGMQAALPFINELRPMHTLAALEAVVAMVGADARREIRNKKRETAPVQRRDRL